MNWKNLVDEKCPKCNAKLEYVAQGELYHCTECSFSTYTRNFKHLTRLWKKEGQYSHEKVSNNKSYYEASRGEKMNDYQLMTA